ncbi:transglutaminase domain-containing protein [Pseudovibrio sp. WM33]|uniref:transglutaminase domain-containing protein n=1 Tax=Pseudovibrio sp. WM33 TaxID=1735585 RepID=UPI0007AE7B83|nr:transglutaminase domain-containing protein [Pseudovibrio sp. WM33]KZL19952.1 Transglutaminase-like superfamily protein [Pseudovibrio sp. WM33]
MRENSLRSLPQIYHHVRNIPYGSTGNRDPKAVYTSNVGSCSGKHILLRDFLREAGYQAEIITMFTYFNESTPVHGSFPEELKTIATRERVPDFHHYVRVLEQGAWLNLDATWHDGLARFGFEVNHDWSGSNHTALASVAEREYPATENIIDLKADLVSSLPQDQRDLRAKYFRLVTEWIATYAS